MDLSVLIPTHARPEVVEHCLRCLVDQTGFRQGECEFEIIVGLDGDEDQTPEPSIPDALKARTAVHRFGFKAAVATRRAVHALASGELILWLNDDSYARENLIETHLRIHREHGPCFLAGGADWKPIDEDADPNLFDLLLHRTDLMFFAEPATELVEASFRDCYGLNMSFPREAAEKAGGVADLSGVYGYEDIELAYRMKAHGTPILFTPDARVTHDHRYAPIDVHRREYLLGRSAWHYAQFNPRFARELFGRDICSEQQLEDYATALELERRNAQRIERSFLNLATLPASTLSIDDPAHEQLLSMLSEHWVPLKRYLWRWGLLDASRGEPMGWSLLSS